MLISIRLLSPTSISKPDNIFCIYSDRLEKIGPQYQSVGILIKAGGKREKNADSILTDFYQNTDNSEHNHFFPVVFLMPTTMQEQFSFLVLLQFEALVFLLLQRVFSSFYCRGGQGTGTRTFTSCAALVLLYVKHFLLYSQATVHPFFMKQLYLSKAILSSSIMFSVISFVSYASFQSTVFLSHLTVKPQCCCGANTPLFSAATLQAAVKILIVLINI